MTNPLNPVDGRRLLENVERNADVNDVVLLSRWLWEHHVALVEAAERDWAVRVLDAQLAQLPTWSSWETTREATMIGPQWSVSFTDSDRESIDGVWDETGDGTPDAARLAAARSVFPDLPEQVRRELGEEP